LVDDELSGSLGAFSILAGKKQCLPVLIWILQQGNYCEGLASGPPRRCGDVGSLLSLMWAHIPDDLLP
jgi:hypothetical protein